jgi:hypothetical protein
MVFGIFNLISIIIHAVSGTGTRNKTGRQRKEKSATYAI